MSIIQRQKRILSFLCVVLSKCYARCSGTLAYLVLMLILFEFGTANAQTTQCKLKLDSLPESSELRGFRLGMTKDQVRARVPQVVFGKTDEFGGSKTSINPYYDPRIDKTPFADVRTVSLDFLDGRLISLWIGYDATFKWGSVDDFVIGISRALALPKAWSPWKTRGQQMKCEDFEITVSMVAGGPSFRILDRTSEETLTARRVAKEEEKAAAGDGAEEAQEVVADKKAKVYYPTGCSVDTEILETQRIVFKNSDEAEKAGYKRAKNCP